MVDHEFDGCLALAQLNCSGTTSVLELMEYGYPSRVPFSELYNMYKSYLPPELVRLEPKTFCEVYAIEHMSGGNCTELIIVSVLGNVTFTQIEQQRFQIWHHESVFPSGKIH